ncbi:polysaccharide deacetylase family protein [Bacillus sp. HMF5848]|uniref:polysaccharide deacetylase family protein n=1 Tax=Bacillus sp. HMF5848 TaxID=2495421 RepID=UPI000F7AC421|nr:polysaccharide deacetylase family protein [Bacillus sp. HMF5848]RSK28311.1 polysaccharide deacetylase family protein [Bacillus sp. HMF5848]
MTFLIRKAIKLILLLPIGLLFRFFKKQEPQATILMYHRVNDDIKKELSVSIENFLWQMNYLKRHQYEVITMDLLMKRVKEKKLTNKTIVLTFDDGYMDYFETTYPILKKFNFPSIQYLVPSYIETDKIFWWDQDLGSNQLMNWCQIVEISKSRLVQFGAHTVNHLDLDRIDEKMLGSEILVCKHILENRLNIPVYHFSYPRGRYNNMSENYVRNLYASGVSIFKGKPVTNKLASTDYAILKRVPIQRSDGKILFIARLKGWLVLEEFLRRLLNKL